MRNGIQMTANSSFLRLKVGRDISIGKSEQGLLREKATCFYWGVFQLLNKAPGLFRHDPRARVLRLSFEDDFEEEDELEEDGFIPVADLLQEEDLLDEEGSPDDEEAADLKDELFYK
jgi:hypothetical protein